jgi:hypothetical protein
MSAVKDKRGQITLFVIIGMLLLIIVGLYLYLTYKDVKPELDVPRLSGDAGAVQEFVEGCIEQIARMGLDELGRHGGYIDPTNIDYTLTTFDYNTVDQTESDLVFMNKHDETSGIPYWYYSSSSRSCWHCEISTLSPSIGLMEYQLGLYVNKHLPECLEDFTLFKEQGLIVTSQSDIKTSALIRDSDVVFFTEYNLQVIRDGEISLAEKFYKEVDVPVLQYYAIATRITQSQIDTEYLDFYGLYLLGQHTGMDSNKLPPLSAYRIGYDTIFWSKSNTQRLYESLLSSYTQFFRVSGTSNELDYELDGGQLELGLYDAMILPMFTDEELSTLELSTKEINHIYAGQRIYLNVRPSNGDLISPFVKEGEPGLGGGILESVEPDQNYEFFYDISYPILVEVRDSRPGKEYSFIFALQGNIKENKLMSDWLAGYGTMPWNIDYLTMYNNVPIGTETEDVETGETYIYEAPQVGKTLFCDAEQRLSGTIRAKTYDSLTGEPLEGVLLTYTCGTYASCGVGKTKYNETLNEVLYSGKMPICLNGYVQFNKQGYISKKIPLTTDYQRSQYLGSIYMDKIYTHTIHMQKYPVTLEGIYVLGSPTDLTANDTVTMTLRKITIDEWDEPWTQTVILGKDNPNDVTIQLVPGMYIVEANLMDYTGITIPKECQELKVPGKNIKIPDSDIRIDVAMWGGVKFDEQNPFVATSEELMNSESITFNIIRAPNPRCLDDMNVMSVIDYMSRYRRSELYPKFS